MALGSWLPQLLVLLLISGCQNARAQQPYNEEDQLGYVCSWTNTCQAYAAYRALPNATLTTVGTLFGVSAEQVARASQLPTSASISPGQLLVVPLNCSCVSGRSQYNTTYIIQKDDTMYQVSVFTFEGLTTYQAVEKANPTRDPRTLEPGDHLIFPIRCSCPSTSQRQAGVRSLVTYSIGDGDTVALISASWNLSTSDLLAENQQATDIRPNTTLLLPVKSDPPAVSTRGTTPLPASPPPTASSPPLIPGGSSSSGLSGGAVAGIVVASAAGAVLAALAMLCVWKARGKRKGDRVGGGNMHYADTPKTSTARDTHYTSSFDVSADLNRSKNQQYELIEGMADMLDSDKPMLFTYAELLKATDEFSPGHRIQGSVYRGVVGGQTVAIKEMKGGAKSQELKILAKVHHTNLVRLIGFCSGGDKLFFVYEYAENGSLNNYLQGAVTNHKELTSGSDSASSTAPLLSWNTRLQVALDVASGLEYIHDYTKPSFVHKDIKSSNILLDSNFRAKIANFGMARLIESRDGTSIPPAALTSHVTGTQGYLAPEYLAHGFVSTKLDVFAYGVVLLELTTGREAVLNDRGNTQTRFLSDVFIRLLQDGTPETKLENIKQWLDPSLDKALPMDIVYSLVLLARSCVDDDPAARPNMKDVTYALSQMVESSVQWETEKGTRWPAQLRIDAREVA